LPKQVQITTEQNTEARKEQLDGIMHVRCRNSVLSVKILPKIKAKSKIKHI